MYNWYIMIIVFLVTLLLNSCIGYVVFGGGFKKNTKINYGVSNFGTMASSVLLFYIIATIGLLILILGRDDLLPLFVQDITIGEQLVNSGLLFAFGLVVIGYIIRGVYKVIYIFFEKVINKKEDKKCLDEIHKNEQTLIIIMSCISLIIVTISQNDWDTALFITALILGKFFWVDATPKDFFSDIHNLFKSEDYKINIFTLLVLFWTFDIYFMSLFEIHYLISNIIGIIIGFTTGMLLYVWKNRHFS
ncbi:MAG: hypothetical protein HDR04_20720 [Lachnospiraceae bacterium]|nr:hypothetical protein [Lachnospiraceae bacterium]